MEKKIINGLSDNGTIYNNIVRLIIGVIPIANTHPVIYINSSLVKCNCIMYMFIIGTVLLRFL